MANVDEGGYLLHPEMWTEDTAVVLAEQMVPGGFIEEHWRVMKYLRQHCLEFGIVPPVKKLCRDTGSKLKDIYGLFPTGLAREACKIAGIPRDTFYHPSACLYPCILDRLGPKCGGLYL